MGVEKFGKGEKFEKVEKWWEDSHTLDESASVDALRARIFELKIMY